MTLYIFSQIYHGSQVRILPKLNLPATNYSMKTSTYWCFSSHVLFPSLYGDFQLSVHNSWHPSRDAIFPSSRQCYVEENCLKLPLSSFTKKKKKNLKSNCISDNLDSHEKEEGIGKWKKSLSIYAAIYTVPS